jgi:hypothetical protein
MHDDMITWNGTEKHAVRHNSNIGFFRVVPNDTTNKRSRLEIPDYGTGERGELSDLMAKCRSSLLDTTNKSCCSMLIGQHHQQGMLLT